MRLSRTRLRRLGLWTALCCVTAMPASGCAGNVDEFVIDETRVREEVRQRFADDPSVDAQQVRVEVSKRVVWLSGKVEDEEAREQAGRLALSVRGVRGVINHLTLDDPEAPDVQPIGPETQSR